MRRLREDAIEEIIRAPEGRALDAAWSRTQMLTVQGRGAPYV